jgi:hypothetical protein
MRTCGLELHNGSQAWGSSPRSVFVAVVVLVFVGSRLCTAIKVVLRALGVPIPGRSGLDPGRSFLVHLRFAHASNLLRAALQLKRDKLGLWRYLSGAL